jgi:hypothetical protein
MFVEVFYVRVAVGMECEDRMLRWRVAEARNED